MFPERNAADGSPRRMSRSIARSETNDSSTSASPSASIESKCR